MKRVRTEREGAAAQIGRSLKAWRKASESTKPHEKDDDQEIDGEAAQDEKGGAHENDKGDAPRAKEKAPNIGAKLESGTIHLARDGSGRQPPKPMGLGYYRGGTSMVAQPDEYKVKNGMVQTTHGLSVFNNPRKPAVVSRGAHAVMSVPPTLKIQQRGQDPEHYEVMPVQPMPIAAYQAVLAQVVLAKYEDK
jgi:hypothetical protein